MVDYALLRDVSGLHEWTLDEIELLCQSILDEMDDIENKKNFNYKVKLISYLQITIF